MTFRRIVVALVSILALVGVCVRAPAVDLLRRTAGCLEAVAVRRHERPTALEKPGELARVRVTRAARATDADPTRDPAFFAPPSANGLLRVAAPSRSDSLAPHPASWVEPSPTHAELNVFLN